MSLKPMLLLGWDRIDTEQSSGEQEKEFNPPRIRGIFSMLILSGWD